MTPAATSNPSATDALDDVLRSGIERAHDLCAVFLMQFLPFVNKEANGLLNGLEGAVYHPMRLR